MRLSLLGMFVIVLLFSINLVVFVSMCKIGFVSAALFGQPQLLVSSIYIARTLDRKKFWFYLIVTNTSFLILLLLLWWALIPYFPR